jgi:cell wall-associated NlpC family hydrolase
MQSSRNRIPATGSSSPRRGQGRLLLATLLTLVAALVALTAAKRAGGAGETQSETLSPTVGRAVARAERMHARRRWLTNRVVYLAWRATGVPYRWGGASPRNGFDCSGLVQWTYSHVGVRLPHYSYGQWRHGRRVARSALHAGDLVFFSGLGHVGIYVGGGRLIHAPHPGARVQVARLSGWFASSFVGGRRLIAA